VTPLDLGALTATLALLAAPSMTEGQPVPRPPAAAQPADASSAPSALENGVWPVWPAEVVTEFDDPLPYAAGHRGIDLAASLGQVVLAAGGGVVTVSGPVAGRSVVVIAHTPSLRTTYLPVTPLVRVGERVHAGEPIGVLAPPWHCLGVSCLHWGARSGDRYIDPRSLLPLDASPIVLLPLDPPPGLGS